MWRKKTGDGLQDTLGSPLLVTKPFRAKWRYCSKLFAAFVIRRLILLYVLVSTVVFCLVAKNHIVYEIDGYRIYSILALISLWFTVLAFGVEFEACGLPSLFVTVPTCAIILVPIAALQRPSLAPTIVFLPHLWMFLSSAVHLVAGLLILPAQVSFNGWGGWLSRFCAVDDDLMSSVRTQTLREFDATPIQIRTADGVLVEGAFFPPNQRWRWQASSPIRLSVLSPFPTRDRSASLESRSRTPDESAILAALHGATPDRHRSGGASTGKDPHVSHGYGSTENLRERSAGATPTTTGGAVEPEEGRVVLMFNGNNEAFEFKDDEIRVFTRRGYGVLAFNFRGVAGSKGWVSRDGLILDADAWFQYLVSVRNVPPSLICLHGTSLGGSVASLLAAMHPGVVLVNDRSFSSLSLEVAHAAPLIFGIEGPSIKYSVFGRFLEGLVCFAGWDLDVGYVWDRIRGPKCVLYHPEDRIIPEPARLVTHLTKKSGVSPLPSESSVAPSTPVSSYSVRDPLSPKMPQVEIVPSKSRQYPTWSFCFLQGDFESAFAPEEEFRVAHCRPLVDIEQVAFFDLMDRLFAGK